MNSSTFLPAGIRLDAWPVSATCQPALVESSVVTELRETLRISHPEIAAMLETLSKLRPIQDLVSRLAGPVPVQLTLQRT